MSTYPITPEERKRRSERAVALNARLRADPKALKALRQRQAIARKTNWELLSSMRTELSGDGVEKTP